MESRASVYQGGIFSTWALATIAIALRFISRYVAGSKYWLDDWFMVPAWVICTANAFMVGIWQVNNGLGKHLVDQPDPTHSLIVTFKGLFITEFFFTFTILFAKLSVLAFYRRIFNRSLTIPIIILEVVVICWAIAVTITVIFQCIPVQGFWDRSINPKCNVNSSHFFFGNAIPNIITDGLLVILPMFPIWKLHMSTMKKIAVSICFLLGGLVTAVSIYRFTILVALLKDLNTTDFTWVYADPQMWVAIEMAISIVSGCLPSLKPVWDLARTSVKSITSSIRSSKSTTKVNDSSNASHPWTQEKSRTIITTTSANSTMRDSEEDSQPLNQPKSWFKQSRTSVRDLESTPGVINVQSDIRVERN